MVRLADAVSGFAVVLLGARLSGSLVTAAAWEIGLLSGLVGFFITAGTIALNDYYDLEIDRINKPSRPIPSGQVSPTAARWVGLICYGIGIMVSLRLGVEAALIACALTGCALLYNRVLKKTILANFTVGILCLGGLYYGMFLLQFSWRSILSGLIVFTFITSREILKTVEDYEGDRQAGVQNFATRFGYERVLQIYWATAALVIVFSFIPFALGQFGIPYLLVMISGVDLLIIIGCLQMAWKPSKENILFALRLTKFSFFFGLLAMALA